MENGLIFQWQSIIIPRLGRVVLVLITDLWLLIIITAKSPCQLVNIFVSISTTPSAPWCCICPPIGAVFYNRYESQPGTEKDVAMPFGLWGIGLQVTGYLPMCILSIQQQMRVGKEATVMTVHSTGTHLYLTLWGLDKIATLFQTTFQKHFLQWKCTNCD